MKPREPRQKVLVRARMKSGAGWHDACILNISSRGMMLQAADPPGRGSYLEIRRGAQVIIARVMWTRSHRFGIKSQDLLSFDAITADAALPPPTREVVPDGERRSSVRPLLAAHEQSRIRGRMMEYGFAATLAVVGAVIAASEVYHLLSRPTSLIAAALDGG